MKNVVGPQEVACLIALMACAGPRPANATEPDPRQQGTPAVIEHIREIYKTTNAEIAAGRATSVVFWEDPFEDTDNELQPGWQRGTEEDAAGKHYFDARAYKIGGRVAKVVISLRDPSGDWKNTTEYYFYASGRTAFRFESHRTFHGFPGDGPFVIERRSYFDEEGRVMRELKRALSEETNREVPVGYVQDFSFVTTRIVYPSVAALPFARLLK